nr:Thivi_2564 family membrane protein [Rhodoplanes sp. Z2-YC6860]
MEPNAEPLVIGAAGCRPDIVSYHAALSAKGSAMATLISALITFVVIILVLYLVNLLPIDGRAKQIVRVIVVIIGILSLLRYLAVF